MGRKSRERKNRQRRRWAAPDSPAPVPPVIRVAAGGRAWEVVGGPIPPGVHPTFLGGGRRTATTFSLAPPLFDRFLGTMVVVGLVALVGWLVWRAGSAVVAGAPPDWQSVAGGGLACLVAGVVILLCLRRLAQNVAFDKRAGRMTRSGLWGTAADVDLAAVVAVQCLYAGRNPGSAGGPRGGGTPPFDAYQINLVLAGDPDTRVNVCVEKDPDWVRATAADLATFLGVPLVDQIAASRAGHGE